VAVVDATRAGGTPKVVILMMSDTGFALVYLGSIATLCVALDRALAGRVALLRILVSWLVPLLGAIVTIRVAVEESRQDQRSRWWLWPLRPLLCRAAPARVCRGYRYASRRGSYAAVTVPTGMHPFTLRTAYRRAVTAISRVSHGIPQATAALALGGLTTPQPRKTPCLAVRFLLGVTNRLLSC
jgi:hypothetical protein